MHKLFCDICGERIILSGNSIDICDKHDEAVKTFTDFIREHPEAKQIKIELVDNIIR